MQPPKTPNLLRWWVFFFTMISIMIYSVTRLILGSQLWQPFILFLAGIVHGFYWLRILFNWQQAQDRYITNQEQWAKEAGISLASQATRRKQLLTESLISIVVSIGFLASAALSFYASVI